MADNCLFCRKLIYEHDMCEEHYKCYLEQKRFVKNMKKAKIEFKSYYHNLKHVVYKFDNYLQVTELCIRLIATADLFNEIYKNDELVKIVIADVNKIIRYKVVHIKENRAMMRMKYTSLFNDIDFRSKWPSKIRTDDGHYVRSRAEQIIDNYLYSKGIVHAYEKLIILNRESQSTLISDFYIPELDLYIEYYGKYDKEYIARKYAKDSIYKENNLNYLPLGKKELDHLDDILTKEFITRRSLTKKGQQ